MIVLIIMKCIILAGGMGTRISEETEKIPKPMVTIGNNPILWHIIKYYHFYDVNDFLISVGYKGDLIRSWVMNQYISGASFNVNTNSGRLSAFNKIPEENMNLSVIETGLHTQTSGRLRMAMNFTNSERVFATYGDGLCDVDLNKLLEFHVSHGKLATVTAVNPPPRFGQLEITNSKVTRFSEKTFKSETRINGGYFILEPGVLNYLKDDNQPFETSPLENLARDGELMAYSHDGFWKPMDTLKDRMDLESLWEKSNPPWKLW